MGVRSVYISDFASFLSPLFYFFPPDLYFPLIYHALVSPFVYPHGRFIGREDFEFSGVSFREFYSFVEIDIYAESIFVLFEISVAINDGVE